MGQSAVFFETPVGHLRVAEWKAFAPRAVVKAGDLTANRIGLSTRQVIGVLVLIAAVLLFANFAVLMANYLTGNNSKVVSKLIKVFSVDYELNIPAFFSSLILLFSSVLLAVISYFKYRERANYLWHWIILTMGFLFMAFDEMASVHEKLIEPMRAFLGGKQLGPFYFAWVVPGIALVVILGVCFLLFWWNLPAKTRVYLFAAATLYLGGALGMELFNGYYAELYEKENLTYMLLSTAEEGLEMTGVIVFIKALLDYFAESYKSIKVDFETRIGTEKRTVLTAL